MLGVPAEQKPSPDMIVSAMIRQEQQMLNRLNGSGRAWTQELTQVTTTANTAEYAVTPSGTTTFGKALFVYRELDDGSIMPVAFTDYTNEPHNQTYEFFVEPMQAGEFPYYSGEKVAFFRDAAGSVKMRIFPAPDDSGKVYKIAYASGRVDWSTFDWSDTPAMPEFADWRTLGAALFLLPYAEWEGHSRQENSARRGELRSSLQPQYEIQDSELRRYINNPQHEPISDIGAWWER